MQKFWVILPALLALQAADFHTPAGTRPARRTEDGQGTVLPGGRALSPYGREFTTGPGPFGLAVSPSGNRIVTADGGPNRFSLSFLERSGHDWKIRRLALPSKADDDEDEWKSTFMGLAFGDEQTLYASEGESGQVRVLDPASGRSLFVYKLNRGGYKNSYSGDLALDRERGILYVVDQANFRVALFDTRNRIPLGSVRVGRLPFAIALSPDRSRVYVTNIGTFEYKVLPGADAKHARETGLEFPPFGFPSREAMDGVMRTNASGQRIAVPGLGSPNVAESNSLAVIDVADPKNPKAVRFVRTGLPWGRKSLGGSSPSGVLAADGRIFVTNSTNDSISVIDPTSLQVTGEIRLRVPGLESFRGFIPIGMSYHPETKQLLVAEAGINAVASSTHPRSRSAVIYPRAGSPRAWNCSATPFTCRTPKGTASVQTQRLTRRCRTVSSSSGGAVRFRDTRCRRPASFPGLREP
ncbi:MAG TPA: hypothetical protein VHB50_11530 [Bryobacteraceae bacterium]|nr:hypothetical protein [Bryobacteraceae bacterium]